MTRHSAQLTAELSPIAAQIDIADLRHVDAARIADARQVGAVTPQDFPGLDTDRIGVEDLMIAPPVAGARGVSRRHGVLVFVHGGAFCLGDLETDHLRCMFYAQETSCTIVSVEYALAPENPYPAALIDVLTALRWVSVAAEGLGADRRRVAIAGESAGGCLSRCRT